VHHPIYYDDDAAKFDEEDLKDLYNFLFKLSDRWFNIGVQLEVDTKDLESIRQHHIKHDDALREMLIIRLRKALDWGTVQAALLTQAVAGQRLLGSKPICSHKYVILHALHVLKRRCTQAKRRGEEQAS